MRTVQRTCFEVLIIGVIGVALGFAANGVRARGQISPTKNYFATGPTKPVHEQPVDPGASKDGAAGASVAESPKPPAAASKPADSPAAATPPPEEDKSISAAGAEARMTAPTAAEAAHGGKKLKHDYQSIEFDQVLEVFNDPRTRQGMNLFVDARNDDNFQAGRIPGAVQCFPYEIHLHIDQVMDRANGVDKIIVYCNGGDCEDSIFTCRELIEAGIPSESIYLYEGGWKEWVAKDMPVEKD